MHKFLNIYNDIGDIGNFVRKPVSNKRQGIILIALSLMDNVTSEGV